MLKSERHRVKVVTVDNPLILDSDLLKAVGKLLPAHSSTVRQMPNHIKIKQRQAGLSRQFSLQKYSCLHPDTL